MKAFVLICEGSPKALFSDERYPAPGQYLKTFDPEYGDGLGHVEFTRDLDEAKKFASEGDAFDYLGTVPACRPIRPDGKPNKPLWATNWSIGEVEGEEP